MIAGPLEEVVAELLRKHGLTQTEPFTRPKTEGHANHTLIFPEIVVKFCKDPESLPSTLTETITAPAALARGAKTPKLIAFDDDRDIHPLPVSIWERVHGEALGDLTSVSNHEELYVQLALEIRTWQSAIVSYKGPNHWLITPIRARPEISIANARTRLPDRLREWCERQFLRLESAPTSNHCFVHSDLHAHNFLVHRDQVAGVIDWGQAGFGDPVLDFKCFPAEFLPKAVEAYGLADHNFIGRLISDVLCYAINAYGIEDWPTLRNTGIKRWRSFEKLFHMSLSEPWRHWLIEPPSI